MSQAGKGKTSPLGARPAWQRTSGRYPAASTATPRPRKLNAWRCVRTSARWQVPPGRGPALRAAARGHPALRGCTPRHEPRAHEGVDHVGRAGARAREGAGARAWVRPNVTHLRRQPILHVARNEGLGVRRVLPAQRLVWHAHLGQVVLQGSQQGVAHRGAGVFWLHVAWAPQAQEGGRVGGRGVHECPVPEGPHLHGAVSHRGAPHPIPPFERATMQRAH